MKTRSIIAVMAALVITGLVGAITWDQVKTKSREIDSLRVRVEDEKKLKKQSDWSVKAEASRANRERMAREIHDTTEELEALGKRLAQIKARKPQTLDDRARNIEDLADVMKRIELAEKRIKGQKP